MAQDAAARLTTLDEIADNAPASDPLDRYREKIGTLEEIADLLERNRAGARIALCHGVFDIVHPGHVRHLLHAKKRADLLVVCVASDAHARDGGPPVELRAANLAAYEVVDFVVIDDAPNPLGAIEALQPDVFAVGFEDGPRAAAAAADAQDLVASYGGLVVVTPGDADLAAARYRTAEPARARGDKLRALMEREGFDFEDLRDTLIKMVGRRVHVVGDSIVDSLTRCAMAGGQTKTPTISVRYEDREDFVGGAGVVAKHLASAGAEVSFTTVLGDDPLQKFVLDDLEMADVDVRAVIDPTRPTTNKNAIVVDGYRLLKVNTQDNSSITGDVLAAIDASVRETRGDAIVFSDFRHGIFNRRTIPQLVAAIPDGLFRVADSQVASRWGDVTEFQGFDLITPNEREARFSLADQDSHVQQLCAAMYAKAGCRTLILKMGERGVLTRRHDSDAAPDAFCAVDSFVGTVVDAVGAGDALLAYATLAQLASGSAAQASVIGSMAAAVECERDGNVPVTPQDVLRKIDAAQSGAAFARRRVREDR